MNISIPQPTIPPAQGWVFYDGRCLFCLSVMGRLRGLLHRHGFELAPLQTPWVSSQLDVSPEGPFNEMLVMLPGGKVFGGADGILQIVRRIWWAWPVFALAQIPGAIILLRAIYRRVAANRHCLMKGCPAKKHLPRRHITTTFFEMP
jgi:predicted DCC family thiol-disulfide oxidoreductase YuxK